MDPSLGFTAERAIVFMGCCRDRMSLGTLASMRNILFLCCSILLAVSGCERLITSVVRTDVRWKALGLPYIPVTHLTVAPPWLYACGGPRGVYISSLESPSGWGGIGFNYGPPAGNYSGWYEGVTGIDVRNDDLLVSYEASPLEPRIGLWRSTDGGKVFRASDSGASIFGTSYMDAVDRSPLDVNIGIATNYDAMYRTTDAGTSWVEVQSHSSGTSAFAGVRWHPHRPNRVWVFEGMELFSSTDAGVSWAGCDLGGYGRGVGCPIMDIAFEAGDTNALYVLTCPGLFRSTDDGTTWTLPMGPNSGLFQTIVAHPYIPRLLYLSSGNTVYRYLDGAGNVPVSLGNPDGTVVRAMAIYAAEGRLFVATQAQVFELVQKVEQ
jgi:photosystem II stability/assembly factor-like uncharacterized protein